MNAKQRAFTIEYMKDKNATQAAIRAGYSERTAYSQAHELLKKLEIKEAIAQLEEEARLKAGITVDTIVSRLNKIAENPDAKDADKIRADELLGKYLGMFTDKVQVDGKLDTGAAKLAGILEQLKEQ